MALIIEDGSGKEDSNSYADTTPFTDYLALTGRTVTGDPEQLLLKAMPYTESQDFKGTRLTKAQALQWPRADVYIDGFLVETDEIPSELPVAQMELAYAIDQGNDPLAPQGRETKKEKVGDLEVEYMDRADATTTLPAVDVWFDKLVVRGNDAATVPLARL